MGEAEFCLVALGANEKIFEEFKKRLDDLVALNDDFQEIREQAEIPPGERWRKLKEIHPLACELLNFEVNEEFLKDDPQLNNLTTAIPDLTAEYVLDYEDGVITLYDYVWHLSKWDGLANWLEDRGCIAAWASEEYVDMRTYLISWIRGFRKEDIVDKLYKLLSEGKVDEVRRLLLALKI